MKKGVLSILMIIVSVFTIWSQSPQSFKYQAVIRDNSGNLIANQSVNIRVSIREAAALGTVVYQESFNPTTTQYGLVNLSIGAGNIISGTFNTITWGANAYYIQLEVNTGSGYVDMGATQLLSVPYALFAQDAAVPGVEGPTGPMGPTGATGPLVSGTTGQTLRHDGSNWLANSALYNNGTNIGIGTSSPSEKLSIFGNVSLGSSVMPVLLKNDMGNGFWALSIEMDGTQRAYINRIGEAYFQTKLGIGTTAPLAQLHTTGTVRFAGAGVPGAGKVLTSDANGTATWQNASSPSTNTGFSAYSNTAQTITSGYINFEAEDYDDGNNFASNAYTAPSAGVYHFSSHVRFNSGLTAGQYIWIGFYVNGSLRKASTSQTSANIFGINISADLKLNAGDVVKVYIHNSSSKATETGSVNTWFTGHKIY